MDNQKIANVNNSLSRVWILADSLREKLTSKNDMDDLWYELPFFLCDQVEILADDIAALVDSENAPAPLEVLKAEDPEKPAPTGEDDFVVFEVSPFAPDADGNMKYKLTEEAMNDLERRFRDLDVLSELRKMNAWLWANPLMRRPISDAKNFIEERLEKARSEKE